MNDNLFGLIDFNELYKKQREKSSHKKKSAKMWDEKAEDINKKIHQGTYNDFIMSKVSLKDVKSVLDVGTGPGTFALNFAPLVEKVVAFDFSEKMLDILKENTKKRDYNNIEIIKADIEGSWSDIPVCDIAIASRCFEVDNLKDSLTNLNNHARKAVYMTFKAGGSFIDDRIFELLKRDFTPKPDYIYVLNALYQMGIYAKVDFVPNDDKYNIDRLKSVDEYIKSISWSLEDLSIDEEQILRKYYFECKDSNTMPAFRNNNWALIYWEK